MMQGDDTRQEPAQPGRAEASEAASAVAGLYRALGEMRTECDELVQALERRDVVDVEIAAWDLSCDWFDAQVALRIVDAVAGPEQKACAKLAMQVRERALVEAFDRAFAQTACWGRASLRLHHVLHRISNRLTVAGLCQTRSSNRVGAR
jgi:hypothetical protein